MKLVICILLILCITSCIAETNDICFCVEKAKSIKGMTSDAAHSFLDNYHCRNRVVSVDGKNLAVTMDYVIGRININIVNKVVSSYSIEGQREIQCH